MNPRTFPWKRVLVAAILLTEVAVLSYVVWVARSGPTYGLVVSAKTASLTVQDQRNVVHTMKIERVVAPTNGWLIVQADWGNGVPDAILGSVWVPAGESRDLTVQLDSLSPVPHRVFVTLLADLGRRRTLEYDVATRSGMQKTANMGSSAATSQAGGGGMIVDKPIIAGDRLVSAHVSLTPLSFAVGASQASIAEATRTVDATSVVIPRVVAPAQSWLSVSIESTSGTITQVLGEKLMQAGETTGVVMPLSQAPGSRPLVATLHVDLGTVGQFDFSPADIGNSYDQPYVAGGQTVSAPIRVVPGSSAPRR